MRRFLPLLVLIAFAWQTLPAPAAAQRTKRKPRAEHTLKVATLAPDGSSWMNIMHAMDDAIRAATDNRVGIKFYPSGVQGDELMVLRKIRSGQLHGGGFTGQGIGAIAPELRVLELPFLFEDYEQVDRVHAALDARFEEILADKGFQLLGWADVGFIYLFTNTPVQSPEDLKRVKMWLWEGDPLATAFFESFDIAPIPLAIVDVLTSLQTGLIDGVYSSPLACVALQWFTRIKHMTDFPLIHALGAMVVDQRAWEKIPAEDRVVVRDVARQHFAQLKESTRAGDAEAIATMRERGIGMATIADDAAATFVAEGRAIWGDQADKLYPAELLDAVKGVLEEDLEAPIGD